jgi:DNA-directed RNA polymerase subunit N (RpoN/RPB10)
MLPPKCFTCGKLLADIEIEWRTTHDRLRNDDTMTDEQVAVEMSKLLDTLQIKTQCCRAQLLTFVELIKIIL